MPKQNFLYPIVIFLLLVFSVVPILAQEATEEPEQSISTPTPNVIATAQALVDDARQLQEGHLNFINTMFSWIQVVGVILALLGILFAFSGWRSWVDLRNQLAEASRIAKSLEETEANVIEKQSNLESQLNNFQELPKEIKTTLQKQQEHSSKQMQALSLVQFAVQQVDVGNRKAALSTLERARNLDDVNLVIKYFSGEVFVREGQYEKGIEYLKTVTNDDNMPDANATLAYALRMLGSKDEVKREEYYGEAQYIYASLRSKHPDLLDISGESAYGALAGLYRDTNRIADAIKTYEEIAKITPSSSYPLNNLGLLHFEHSDKDYADVDKGKAYFRKALRKAKYALQAESADYWRLFDLITAEIALGNTDWEVIQLTIDEMLDYQPNPDDLQKLIQGLEALKRSQHAPQLVTQALAYIENSRVL